MSDAREIVQPRWKRRATEIAEAIGGTSTGTSSVSLDSNTITELSQAIADAIDLKVLDINIRKYDDNFVSSSGIPIRTGVGVASGQFMPLRVRTEAGDKIDVNIKKFNDVDVDSRGVPVQAGRTTTNNTLVPLVVNCPTVNNFPSGGGGGTSLTVSDIEIGTSNAINTTLRNPNFPLAVDLTRIRGTNVATSPAGVGSHLPIVTYSSALSVTETNPVSGGGGGTSLTQQQVETAMDNALANATGISVTETAPVTTVAVSNHPTSTTITGTVAVTETAPVTTVAVSNHPTTTEVTLPLDANGVPIPMKVTETHPVLGTNVQEVKIVGDDTYGIIMTKIAQTTATRLTQYASVDYGTVGRLQPNLSVANGDNLNTGWIIRSNGVDIYHQDITLGIVDDNGTVDLNLIEIPVTTTVVNGQTTVDKYHGRKVTLSSVANVWIVEPIPTYVQDVHEGIIMTKTFSSQGYLPNSANINGDYLAYGYGFGVGLNLNGVQGVGTQIQTTGWTIMHNGTEITNQDITLDLRGTAPVPLTTANIGNSANMSSLAASYPRFIQVDSQATVDKYHGRKVTLSSVANVWIVEPEPVEHLQGHVVANSQNPSGSSTYIWKIRLIGNPIGQEYTYQRVYNAGAIQYAADFDRIYGARVIKYGVDKWFVEVIDAI